MHILEEWRMRDVEQKAERANSRLYELDSLRSDVGSLERADREICALIDGLRAALDATLDRVAQLERTVEELTANAKLNDGPGGPPFERPVGRPEPERAGFLAQIEACRREVAQWPEWMRQKRTVPAWMANHATDL